MKKELFSQHKSESLEQQNWGAFELVYYSVPCPVSEEINEDSLAVVNYDDNALAMVVSDGAGGHPKGEEASHFVVSSVVEALENFKMKDRFAGLRNPIMDGIESANSQLLGIGSGSKSTASACEIVDGRLRTYQVGDSGILVCGQKGKLKFKSLFHSPAGYGVEAGLLEEQEALEDPNLNVVANMVGDRAMSIEVGPVIELDRWDTVLIASDGLFDNFSVESITEFIRAGSITESAEQILQFFKKRLETDPDGHETKYDDLSFVICRLNAETRGS